MSILEMAWCLAGSSPPSIKTFDPSTVNKCNSKSTDLVVLSYLQVKKSLQILDVKVADN